MTLLRLKGSRESIDKSPWKIKTFFKWIGTFWPSLIEVQFGFKEAIWVKPLADATTTTQGSLSIPPKLLWICCCPSKQDKWHNLLSFFAAKVKTCNLAMARVKRFLFKASLFFKELKDWYGGRCGPFQIGALINFPPSHSIQLFPSKILPIFWNKANEKIFWPLDLIYWNCQESLLPNSTF